MAVVTVCCLKCNSEKVIKAGKSKVKAKPEGIQKYKCLTCKKYFQLEYIARGRLPEVKEQIVEMSSNGSGIRDTARVLKISTTTVISTLKKSL